MLSRTFMLEKAKDRDVNFDGVFITGVLSTGIYCLPSCPARNPKPENVTFFKTEREAKQAGLRACRRCRPDDFYANYDPDLDLAKELNDRVRNGLSQVRNATHLAEIAGVGTTRLNELFREYFQIKPAQYLRQVRIEEACTLLLKGLPVNDVWASVGFEASSSFFDSFRRLVYLSPGAFRNLDSTYVFRLPSGYRTDVTLSYWSRDAKNPTEKVEGDCFYQAQMIDGQPVSIKVSVNADEVQVSLEPHLTAQQKGRIHLYLLRQLGLHLDVTGFEKCLAKDPLWSKKLGNYQGIHLPNTATIFEGLTWAILGQQVNLNFAYEMRRRIIQAYGKPANNGCMAHPQPEDLAVLDYAALMEHKVSRRKAEYLIDVARLIANGALDLEALRKEPAVLVYQKLMGLRGIGQWTANYVMMRSFGFPDCPVLGDAGLNRALQHFYQLDKRPSPETGAALMAPFSPYRSLATAYFWKTLEAL